MITHGSLFSGIGGIDLGFDRAGIETRWQVEIDPYCRKVLAKHWPNVKRYEDITKFPDENVERVDIISGGFPCQDISYAGAGAGLDGERSGLFFEAIRVVRELRPRIVVLENVAGLLTRGLDRVLGTLAEIGFDAEWHCIPAASVGAPHIRDRVFIIGTDTEISMGDESDDHPSLGATRQEQPRRMGCREAILSNADGQCDIDDRGVRRTSKKMAEVSKMANTNESRPQGRTIFESNARAKLATFKRSCREQIGQWSVEPAVGRVANGVPNRVDRLRGLGNAVVPQVAEWIGKQLAQAFES